MSKPNVIHINVSGSVQTGKSAVLQSIKGLLEGFNYCVAVPERSERNNPSTCVSQAEHHEKPSHDKTVFVLTETTTK